MSPYNENLALYQALVALQSEIPRKGKTNPYTSLNGHMFSFLDKEGTLGLRMSSEDKAAFEAEYNSPPFIQHNKVMKEYVAIPQHLLIDTAALYKYFNKSIQYIKSLKPKPTKKNK